MKKRLGMLYLLGALILGLLIAHRPLQRVYYRIDYESLILREAKNHSLSPHLLAAVIFTESRFRTNATSGAGARGLMQLMPETAQEMAYKERLSDFTAAALSDPELNIRLGSRYLAELKGYFPSDRVALAAYNAGPTLVDEWQKSGKGIVYQETKEYVNQVLYHREVLEGLYPEWR